MWRMMFMHQLLNLALLALFGAVAVRLFRALWYRR